MLDEARFGKLSVLPTTQNLDIFTETVQYVSETMSLHVMLHPIQFDGKLCIDLDVKIPLRRLT
jgi:hypothetical protein